MFTANPATGERGEMVVNASFGLGEAVVGGQITPDTFVVDRETLAVKETVLGAKDRMVVSEAGQGTRIEAVPGERQRETSLLADRVSELAGMAADVERTFSGVPQDVEWAYCEAAGFVLVQSRPITNLPSPPPKDVTWPEIPGAQLLKRQVAENMPDPLSPLFEDLYLRALFDVQKWPEGWEWKGNETRNWMKNFVVVTVNGYAYQPIYRHSGGRLGQAHGQGSLGPGEALLVGEPEGNLRHARVHDQGDENGSGTVLDVPIRKNAPHVQEVPGYRALGTRAVADVSRRDR